MDFIINNYDVKVFQTTNELFEGAAIDFSRRSIEAVNKNGEFYVAISGGNTPKIFFDILAHTEHYKKDIPWNKIKFFFGDERYVSSTDVNSNYRTVYDYLFSKVPVNPENIYRIQTEYKSAKEAAMVYEILLKKVFKTNNNSIPQFDLFYLGLGNNAHTASLMPFNEVVKNSIKSSIDASKHSQLVSDLFDLKSNMQRITLTPLVINHSKIILFLVAGLKKASAVWQVLKGPLDPLRYPAQLIHSELGKTIWYLDKDASRYLI